MRGVYLGERVGGCPFSWLKSIKLGLLAPDETTN